MSCASNPNRCSNGTPNNVLTAGACAFGGGFTTALNQQRMELERLKSERKLTALEMRSLEQEADDLSGNIVGYHSEIDRIDGELIQLRHKLDMAEPKAEKRRALQSVLFEEVASLQNVLDLERKKNAADRADIIKLKTEVERRRIVLLSLTRDVLEE